MSTRKNHGRALNPTIGRDRNAKLSVVRSISPLAIEFSFI